MSELISKNEVIELIKKYKEMAVPRWDERFTSAYSGLGLLSKLLKEIEQMDDKKQEVLDYLAELLIDYKNEKPPMEKFKESLTAEEVLEKPEFEMIPAKLYFRKKLCPECGSDYMTRNSDNIVLMTNPPQYGHHCPTCGHTETYFVQYPEIVYKEEPDEV